MPKRGGLGRGLDALIPSRKPSNETKEKTTGGDKTLAAKEAETKQKKTAGSGTSDHKGAAAPGSGAAPANRQSRGKSQADKAGQAVSDKKKKAPENAASDAGEKKSKQRRSSTREEAKKPVPKQNDISEEARRMADAIISGSLKANVSDSEDDEAVSGGSAPENDSKALSKATVKEIEASKKSEQLEKKPKDSVIAAKTGKEDPADSVLPDSSDVKEEITAAPAAAPGAAGSAEPKNNVGGEIVNMRLSAVEPNRDQPRKYFDEDAIDELADSIRQFGIISPLLVQKKDGYYEIIAGERRWRAAKKAGLKEIPVIIREFSSQEAVEISLIENIQREDLNPIEEAKAYDRLVTEYGLAQEEVAGRVSKSRSAIANSMRLLRLVPEVQKMVETGELSEGHARTIIPIIAEDAQIKIAEKIVKERLTVRQTEKIVRELLHPSRTKIRMRDEQREALLQSLSENLKAALGTKVSIHQSGRNKGRIEIEYYSDDELDRLYELLRAIR